MLPYGTSERHFRRFKLGNKWKEWLTFFKNDLEHPIVLHDRQMKWVINVNRYPMFTKLKIGRCSFSKNQNAPWNKEFLEFEWSVSGILPAFLLYFNSAFFLWILLVLSLNLFLYFLNSVYLWWFFFKTPVPEDMQLRPPKVLSLFYKSIKKRVFNSF